jgi:hypothetical protein
VRPGEAALDRSTDQQERGRAINCFVLNEISRNNFIGDDTKVDILFDLCLCCEVNKLCVVVFFDRLMVREEPHLAGDQREA